MGTELGPGGIHVGMTPLDVAMTQLGVREEALNRGRQVDLYLRSVRLDLAAPSGYPWCVGFVHWCCAQVGVFIPRTASVRRLWTLGKGLRVKKPQPGDIAIHLRANGTGHAGFFIREAEELIETIDGNTGVDDQSPADRVAIRRRPAAFWTGFLRPVVPRVA